MTTTPTRRGETPLLGWLICMLLTGGVGATAAWADPGCSTALTAVWALTEIGLVVAALVLLVRAMFWHESDWLVLLVPLALVTVGVLGFVVYIARGWLSCDVLA